MRIGRPTPPVMLTVDERETLEQWARRPKTAQALAQRARIVLACATEDTNGDIALAAGDSPDGGAVACPLRAETLAGLAR